MIKHPIKTALFAAGTAALIIGTGGAATPFLIGAGLAFGGFQVSKGVVNAITADTREKTLAALEDTGEGVFTVAASVAGAKSYASGTSAGSATAAAAKESTNMAKFWAYSKGLAKDSWTALKDTPNSARTTLAMIKSGEVSANLQSVYGSAKLATQHRSLAKTRLENGSNSYKYNVQKQVYDSKVKKYNTAMDKRATAVAKKYSKMLDALELEGKQGTSQYKILERAIVDICENGLAKSGGISAIKNNLNLINNLPEENLAIAYASQFGNNNENEFVNNVQTYLPLI